ncbi:MAG: alpha/beta fold hydrolase [Bacteroidales bacterium]|nr:alpha/beta fold hydrolase [Bacteroidales bacterium]MBN2757227.1 alpha/beta fold hydrolase [Bacteroidales bacterium]
MPLINSQTYTTPFLFRNYHLNTIFPALFRKIKGIKFQRIRINTPDDDFIDLDFSRIKSESIAILIHGLEGNAAKAYMKGLTRILNKSGMDVAAINLRGCSNQINKKYYSYHSGKTEDLDSVINYISDNYNYNKMFIAGFSLGGNLALKYVGEKADKINPIIKKVVGISVPCDLKSTAFKLNKADNWIYQKRFINSLKKKALEKIKMFPEFQNQEKEIRKSKNFIQFDNLVTAPANGFNDAEDYWIKNSCKPFLNSIRIPALLINAMDDPFLTDESYPFEEAKQNPNFYFEFPKYGGHVGFINRCNFSNELWHEKRILEFFLDV